MSTLFEFLKHHWVACLALLVSLFSVLLVWSSRSFLHDVRKEAIVGPTAIIVDGSRRIMIVDSKGRICAEPSPDTISSIVANVAAEAVLNRSNGGNLMLSALNNEHVTKLFERSQGIQALRDGMYRLCEAYINEAIPQAVYEAQMTDLTATLNFIVPIELCTKLQRDIVEQIVARIPETVIRATEQPVPAADVPAEDIRLLDLLSFRFIAPCLELSHDFGSRIAINSNERLRNRREHDLAVRKLDQELELFLPGLTTSPMPGPVSQ